MLRSRLRHAGRVDKVEVELSSSSSSCSMGRGSDEDLSRTTLSLPPTSIPARRTPRAGWDGPFAAVRRQILEGEGLLVGYTGAQCWRS